MYACTKFQIQTRIYNKEVRTEKHDNAHPREEEKGLDSKYITSEPPIRTRKKK